MERREDRTDRTIRPGAAAGDGGLPTVREVLDLDAFAAGRPEMFASEAALDARVRWVHVSASADVARLLDGGELLLSTGQGWPADPSELRAVIGGLAGVGLSGLVLELGAHYRYAPVVVVDAARQAGLWARAGRRALLDDLLGGRFATHANVTILRASRRDSARRSGGISGRGETECRACGEPSHRPALPGHEDGVVAVRRFELTTTVRVRPETAIDFLMRLDAHRGMHPYLRGAEVTASGVDGATPWWAWRVTERPALGPLTIVQEITTVTAPAPLVRYMAKHAEIAHARTFSLLDHELGASTR